MDDPVFVKLLPDGFYENVFMSEIHSWAEHYASFSNRK